jgi:hypothetical protein
MLNIDIVGDPAGGLSISITIGAGIAVPPGIAGKLNAGFGQPRL